MRRVAAVLAMILVALVLVATVVSIFDDVRRIAVGALLLLVTLMAGWFALTGFGTRRFIAVVVGMAAVVGFVAFAIHEEGTSRFGILGRVAAFLVAAVLARFALGRDVRSLKATPKDGLPVAAAVH